MLLLLLLASRDGVNILRLSLVTPIMLQRKKGKKWIIKRSSACASSGRSEYETKRGEEERERREKKRETKTGIRLKELRASQKEMGCPSRYDNKYRGVNYFHCSNGWKQLLRKFEPMRGTRLIINIIDSHFASIYVNLCENKFPLSRPSKGIRVCVDLISFDSKSSSRNFLSFFFPSHLCMFMSYRNIRE